MYNKIGAFILFSLLFSAHSLSAQTVPDFVQSTISEHNLTAGQVYANGFEDINSFSGFYIVPQGHNGTATHTLDDQVYMEGNLSHKAYQYGQNPVIAGENTNHRAYPTIQMGNTLFGIKTSTVLVDFWVLVDMDLFDSPEKDWLSLATFSSYDDDYWPHSYLINVDIDYKVHFQHIPAHSQNAPDIFHDSSITLTRNQWVRITMYMDYTSNNQYGSPVVALWQDGQLISASSFNPRIDPSAYTPAETPPCANGWDGANLSDLEAMCGFIYTGGLAQMHFGLYTPPLLSTGVIYNDKLEITEILKE